MMDMNGFWDWLGRVVMLVLAGMITLSIIGAIASIPSQSIETRLGVASAPTEWPQPRPSEPAPVPAAPPEAEPLAPAPPPQSRIEPQPAPPPPPQAAAPAAQAQLAPAPRPRPTAADWLEAITYALIAIAGLLAFALLLLFRALGHWRRSADALEALSRRP
jgi:hypothetical protein